MDSIESRSSSLVPSEDTVPVLPSEISAPVVSSHLASSKDAEPAILHSLESIAVDASSFCNNDANSPADKAKVSSETNVQTAATVNGHESNSGIQTDGPAPTCDEHLRVPAAITAAAEAIDSDKTSVPEAIASGGGENSDETSDEEDDDDAQEEDEEEAEMEDDGYGVEVGSWTAEDEKQWSSESVRDYYAALGLSRKLTVSTTRVRAAYARGAVRTYPDTPRRFASGRCTVDEWQVARRTRLRQFWLVTEAYLVLKDTERRRIYDECGFDGLRKSEACYEESVFEVDAFQIYEDFFSGKDPDDRDFLLLNGSNDVASGDEDEQVEENEDEEVLAALRASHMNDVTNAAGLDASTSSHLAAASTTDQALAALSEAQQRLPAQLAAALAAPDASVASSSFVAAIQPPKMHPPSGLPPVNTPPFIFPVGTSQPFSSACVLARRDKLLCKRLWRGSRGIMEKALLQKRARLTVDATHQDEVIEASVALVDSTGHIEVVANSAPDDSVICNMAADQIVLEPCVGDTAVPSDTSALLCDTDPYLIGLQEDTEVEVVPQS